MRQGRSDTYHSKKDTEDEKYGWFIGELSFAMYGPQKSFIHSFSLFKKKKNTLSLEYLRQIVKNRISSSFKLSFKLRLKENVKIYLEGIRSRFVSHFIHLNNENLN